MSKWRVQSYYQGRREHYIDAPVFETRLQAQAWISLVTASAGWFLANLGEALATRYTYVIEEVADEPS